jgi:hypothetical protein
MTTLGRTLGAMRALVPAAICAWALTLLAGWAGAVTTAVLRGSSSISELATIYVPVMIVPFGLTTTAVTLPLVAFAAVLVERRRAWLLPLAGLAGAPLGVVALVALGRVVFSGRPRVRTLLADLAAAATRPESAAVLIALGLGGIFLGLWAVRTSRPGSVGVVDSDRGSQAANPSS